jgi:hypothetical protein
MTYGKPKSTFSITNYVLRILLWVVACRPICYSSKCSVLPLVRRIVRIAALRPLVQRQVMHYANP